MVQHTGAQSPERRVGGEDEVIQQGSEESTEGGAEPVDLLERDRGQREERDRESERDREIEKAS